ncbi:hypothetical protein [Actinomadura atramentaria]|uniref:hypothetical protein n=1 Tax=Actinomadura atramentaria TaxID=1990 RepID=UPI0003744467|nr:hypothetical protein [Actinomadura atramentaria]
MAWSWKLERADGADETVEETFPTRSDAESWLGENWRALRADGATRAVLLDDDAKVAALALDEPT